MTIHALFPKIYNAKRRLRRRKIIQAIYDEFLYGSFYHEDRVLPKVKRSRVRRPRHSYMHSNWGRVLTDLSYRDPTHFNGRTFRNRFRVPCPVFEDIVQQCRNATNPDGSPWWDKASTDCCGQITVPLELLVLGCLRVLGRGMCFDGLNELSNISIESHRSFFHKFTDLFGNTIFKKHCFPPTTPLEIDKILMEYQAAGLPGCIGSCDVTHVVWDRVPYKIRPKYSGKEKYPTVAYEVVCTHTRRIISCSQGFSGSTTDLTIVKYDDFVQSMHRKTRYADIQYELVDVNNVPHTVSGL